MQPEYSVSVTFRAHFSAAKQFQARALGMELGLAGLITQVNRSTKNGPWSLYIYFRYLESADEFDNMARHIEALVKAWGGVYDGWDPPDEVEIDSPGDWQDVELFPIQTIVARDGTVYKVKFDPMY